MRVSTCTVVFPAGIEFRNLVVHDFGSCVQLTPGQTTSGGFSCQVDLDLSPDGGSTWASYAGIPATAHVTFSYLSSALDDPCHVLPPGHTANTYSGSLDQLDFSDGGLPAYLMIRESPTLSSSGRTANSWANYCPDYEINSFFDVFTELSIDGGMTWLPALSSCTVNLWSSGPVPAKTSTWGAIKTLYR